MGCKNGGGTGPANVAVVMLPRLSKSTYLAGKQCHLRLWHNFHARHLATPYDEAQLLTFAAGHEVGELACRRYPGGHRIAHDHHQVPEALAETQRILKAGTAPALFEPAFEHDHVFMRPDVLERLPTAGWRLVEVKSTLSVKPVFIRDVALQLWVLRGAGVDVRDAGVLTLNRGYVYDGVGLDVDALFKFHPVFEQALALQDGIRADAQAMRAMLARTEAPAIAPGDHCFDPYACAYHAHCTRGLARQEHPIAELPRVTAARRAELEAAGIREIKDIPDDFPLNRLQKVVRRAVRQSRVQVRRRQLDRALAAIKPPVRHLDFETFAPAIPRFAGARPYETIPFLFSVHAERDGQPPEHTDYLHEAEDDPRPVLAERLLDALGQAGSICTYSRYEWRILRDLAAALPRHADALAAVQSRLVDLCPIVRSCCYHPDFRGSFSLKDVLPALVPGLGYDDLSLADGRLAAALYHRVHADDSRAERQRTFAALRTYCQRDTLATLELRKALTTLA